MPANLVIQILGSIVCCDNSDPDPIKFNTCSEIINSDLFTLDGTSKEIFDVAKKFIIRNIPDTKFLNIYDVNEKTKENLFNLTKTLYERIKTTSISDDLKEDFYQQMLVDVLPLIVKLCSVQGGHQSHHSQTCAEITLISLLGELSEGSFGKLRENKNFSEILNKLLRILNLFTESSVLYTKGYKMKIMALNGMINLFRHVAKEDLLLCLIRDSTSVVETFFNTVCTVITFQDCLLQEQTDTTRAHIIQEYGDIPLDLSATLSTSINNLDHDSLYKLVTFDPTEMKIMDALFLASISVRGKCQKHLLKLLLKFMESEFFGTDYSGNMSQNMIISFTWLVIRIVQFSKSYSSNSQFTNHQYKQVFKDCVREEYDEFHLDGVDKKDVDHFKKKIQIAGKLIGK